MDWTCLNCGIPNEDYDTACSSCGSRDASRECDECKNLYNTGETSPSRGWFDEMFCANCYHEMYPCPQDWCGWEECPMWEVNHGK